MVYIKKLKVKNFKKFKTEIFDFNNDVNILVGDNDSGKSTILESMEMALNCSCKGKPLANELKSDLFNLDALKEFLESDKSFAHLPEICIEVFLDGVPEYKGINNSLAENSDGVCLTIKFDPDLKPAYDELLKNPDDIRSIPVEFYTIEWLDFAWNKIKFLNKKVNSLFVDPTRLHPTYGKSQYISKILNASLTKDEHALLNINYRQLKETFNNQDKVKGINERLDEDNAITDKKLEIIADLNSSSNFESGLQLAINDISLPQVGKGEQNSIQIKIALQNKASNIDIIMLEEPENHLSHINLTQLINYIESKRDDKQLFITTHSSYVLNKLSLEKLCLIANEYKRFKDIDKKTSERLKRLPGYDTLRVVLSSKVILVEGPSDELVLKRLYLDLHGKLPEEDGIDIIVVRGIGFKNYLEIAKHIKSKINVLKDNDKNYQHHLIDYSNTYTNHNNIKFSFIEDNSQYSLEPVLIATNAATDESLDLYAKVVLSTVTYNIMNKLKTLDEKMKFLVDWYNDEGGAGTKKVDSAMRIFDKDEEIIYPDFFHEVIKFD